MGNASLDIVVQCRVAALGLNLPDSEHAPDPAGNTAPVTRLALAPHAQIRTDSSDRADEVDGGYLPVWVYVSVGF